MTARLGGLPLPLPDPPLRSGAIELRPWHLDDVDALVAAWADPDIARWTGVPASPDADTARRWIGGEADRRAHGLALDLVVVRDGTLVGEVGLVVVPRRASTAEVGWWTAADHRGQGSAGVAAGLLASWALEELNLTSVLARCAIGNPASASVARAAGFTPIGTDDEVELWALGSPDGGAIIGA